MFGSHAALMRGLDRQFVALDDSILQVTPPFPHPPIIPVLLAQHELVAPYFVLASAPPYPMEFVFLVQHIENRLNASFGFQRGVQQILRVADAKINRLRIGCRTDGEKMNPGQTEETKKKSRRKPGVHGNKPDI